MTNGPIDLDVYNELKDATGDKFAVELVSTFLDEAPGMMADLTTALAGGDADGYRRAAHSLKSNAATFGACSLAELARKIELGDMPEDGDLTGVNTLQTALDMARSTLQDLING
ncbi:Hpt domain-containing protein [Ruegeria halocynthiae]|uniref:Hpt domain-containing protein n=1 Tax=Ruegeria halocynthiae TaxID=985054 RepID=A0A1H2WB85_9RHOB|nr:Hpt domain-containing protein [Ruegeria halocynthiae]SDW77811.1 Hpt domain-containing protein [Ruegeria halocynthiae]